METLRTIGDLLQELCGIGLERIASFPEVKQPRTIGDMFEGLTGSILGTTIPEGLDLRIANGFIQLESGGLSTEYDRMLVRGMGKVIPFTNASIFEPADVIAIISVKKSLTSKLLGEELIALSKVKATISHSTPVHPGFIDAYRSITAKDYSDGEEFKRMRGQEQFLLKALKLETSMPVRILFSYRGYKSESGLRNAIMNHVEQNNGILGPVSLPNLIICGKYSVVKANGLPFVGPIDSEDRWDFYLTSNNQPFYYLLEVVLSRISYLYSISIRNLDDLILDSFNRFLCARPRDNGWDLEMKEMNEKTLEKRSDDEWSPTIISELQLSLLTELHKKEVIDPQAWLELSEQTDIPVPILQNELIETGLVYITSKNEHRMVHDSVTVGQLPDGQYFATPEATSRIELWIKKKYPDGVTRAHFDIDTGQTIVEIPKSNR